MSAVNPFESPLTAPLPMTGRHDAKIYGQGALTLCLFVGGPIAGALLLGENARRLGRSGSVLASIAGLAVAAFLLQLIVPGVGRFLMYGAFVIAHAHLFKGAAALRDASQPGGPVIADGYAPWWHSLGFAVAGIAGTFGVAFAVSFVEVFLIG